MSLAGKVALVTGATSGIGRQIALAVAREGASVAVVGRNAERGAATVSEVAAAGGDSFFVPADSMRTEDLDTMVERVLDRWGRLDLAVNNAGAEQRATNIVETDDAEMERVIDTDLKGCWRALRRQIPPMRRQGGAIVNISSFWGVVGMAGGSSYAAAKGGIIALTRAVAAEEGLNGIRVNTVSPGAIRTAMLDRVVVDAALDIDTWARDRTMLGRTAGPEEVAEAVLFLLTDRSSYMTGQNLLLDGGYTVM